MQCTQVSLHPTSTLCITCGWTDPGGFSWVFNFNSLLFLCMKKEMSDSIPLKRKKKFGPPCLNFLNPPYPINFLQHCAFSDVYNICINTSDLYYYTVL